MKYIIVIIGIGILGVLSYMAFKPKLEPSASPIIYQQAPVQKTVAPQKTTPVTQPTTQPTYTAPNYNAAKSIQESQDKFDENLRETQRDWDAQMDRAQDSLDRINSSY